MFIVLGATGHIGSELVRVLDAAGKKVKAIVHNAGKAEGIRTANVEPVLLDVGDSAQLRDLFRSGRRAFLLNPPADPSGNTDDAETATARAITDALQGSDLEKIVVASTYGAQSGQGIGDLSVLFGFERQAEASGIPTAINRAAYYYTNLDMLLGSARKGVLQTPFPAGMSLPMVSPVDIAKAAASRLLSAADDTGIRYIEGPRRYTFDDVAVAFSTVLGRPVRLETIPREMWEDSFRAAGFSSEAARAYARMTAVTVDDPQLPVDPLRGDVTLLDHITSLNQQ
jgi:uncharacterized protein YbjT (DUF2867 family)